MVFPDAPVTKVKGCIYILFPLDTVFRLYMIHIFVATISKIGEWRSLVARFVRDEEAAGSNPVSPTKYYNARVGLTRSNP